LRREEKETKSTLLFTLTSLLLYLFLCVSQRKIGITIIDVGRYITWASGRGLGPGNGEFFGPCEMAWK
jgi:hypothetical protein